MFIGIWILNPLKTSGGQPMAFGGLGIWLGGWFLSWILIIDPCKVINLRSSSKLASVP